VPGPAAFIAEPLLSSGGILDLPLGCRARALSRAGMLLILDEAQTGMGRTGTMFVLSVTGPSRHPDAVQDARRRPAAGCGADHRRHRGGGPRRGFLFYTTHVSTRFPPPSA
jgi:2,2-dialkylglycine decarboxylase (pyruvate)